MGIKSDYFIAELELVGKDVAAKTNPLAELSDYLPGLEALPQRFPLGHIRSRKNWELEKTSFSLGGGVPK